MKIIFTVRPIEASPLLETQPIILKADAPFGENYDYYTKAILDIDELYSKYYQPLQKHDFGSDLINYFLGIDTPKTSNKPQVSMGVWDYYNITMGFLNGTRFLYKSGSIACQ